MALILSLETSTDVCSVALHDDQVLVGESSISEPQAHASRLAPLIQQLLSSFSVSPAQLKAVAVSAGPGSYTGLRIGASTAKGICFALGIPLVSVPTLHLIAYQGSFANPDGALLCPMIDARRMEVYMQVFDKELKIIRNVEAVVIDENSFSELLGQHKMLFFGNGAGKCREVIRNANAVFLEGISPSATFLGDLAVRKFQSGDVEDVVSFKPFYLKDFIAKKAQPLLD
jgi:tRNA threonylcarbamoyladenosine biosynthesis protein TsaB